MKDDKPSPTGYFLAILFVLGGSWLISSHLLSFTYIGLLLSGVLIPVVLLYGRQYWKKQRYRQKLQTPVKVLERYPSPVGSALFLSEQAKDDHV